MDTLNRRGFLEGAAKGAAAAALTSASYSRVLGANEKVALATIGVGGRGQSLTGGFARRDDCEILWLCEADEKRGGLAELINRLENEKGRRPNYTPDLRNVLEDGSVDAVVIATSDHWHGPAAVWACQAGKDVYVEKPPSHNVWEGRKMVEAARKYKRVVQVGTQNRSAPYNGKAREYIQSGKLGTVHLCKVYNLLDTGPFHIGPDQPEPENLHWDLWLGPVPYRPYNPDVHGGWKNLWDFTGGLMTDDGIHQLDLARMVLGLEYPTAVHCAGGNFAYKDDREVPDTQVVSYDFPEDIAVTFDQTWWTPYCSKTPGEIRYGDGFPDWFQNSCRIEIYGTEGMMLLGRHGGGWQVFSAGKEVVAQEPGYFPDDVHKENFIQCVRDRSLPNADIETGHRSACWVHLANIAYRVGRKKLEFDAQSERFVNAEDANRLLKREYREPYVIPEEV